MSPTEAIVVLIIVTIIIVAIIAIVPQPRCVCPSLKGNFALSPTMKGTTLSNCGIGRNEPCIRTIETADEAILFCQQYQCQQFFIVNSGYSVELTSDDLRPDITGNTFILQTGYSLL